MSAPSNVKLLLCFDESGEVALCIPLAQSTTFAIAPLKWLRFLGFVIYGQQGYLSIFMNGPELDYAAEIEARSYYFISDGEPCFADVDAIDNRTSTTSKNFSTERADFRKTLIERDGTCVLTGDPPDTCNACHFIPHSKGDLYMLNLFNHRRETYGLMEPLDDIDDPRNGILLHLAFHRALYRGDIAFLKTPNFSLTVDDIPYLQPPNAGGPESRLTLQHIQPADIGKVLLCFAPHNIDARQLQDISQWPPAIITDLCYAAAVLRAWGPQNFIEHIRANSKDSYYVSGMEGDNGEAASADPTIQVPHQPTARTLRYEKRSAKKAQAADPTDKSTLGDMFDVVSTLWKKAAREGKRRQPVSDAADVADNTSKVQTWLQSTEESNL